MSNKSEQTLPDIFPILGEELTYKNSFQLDLSRDNKQAAEAFSTSTEAAILYIKEELKRNQRPFAFGGFLEDRAGLYSRSEHFGKKEELRSIHLGIDIWSAEPMPIYCPLEGKIHSFQNNLGFGNYGPTLILEHSFENRQFFSLYGHLSIKSMKNWRKGRVLRPGDQIGELGIPKENIGWPIHLHFQIIQEMGENSGDFPGVCKVSELEKYKGLLRNPSLLLNYPNQLIT